MQICFEYEQLDSWFFKESRPMDALGNNEMQSLFPPTAYSFSGITRSFLGSQANINWQAYQQGNGTDHSLDSDIDFCDVMGNPKQSPNEFGSLKFKGCFPSYQGETLLPAPLCLVENDTGIHSLTISEHAYRTDLGYVRLPEMPDAMRGAKPLENTWLTLAAFNQVLQGKMPKVADTHSKSQMQVGDARLGIALSHKTRSTIKGQLYQTSHIRLNPDYALHNFVDVDQRVIPMNKQGHLIRFGAEGRQAHVAIKETSLDIPQINNANSAKGLVLYFLTHTNFHSNPYPKHFERIQNAVGQDIWTGELNGISINIESAIMGKAVREGGWNLARHQPKPATQLIPAGTCWFITSDHPLEEVASALHMTHIGQETQLGRGLIACGIWK